MDQEAVAFARCWARRYVRTKHPHGLDEGGVENRILESLYYNKDKKKSLSEALNAVQNESRRMAWGAFRYGARGMHRRNDPGEASQSSGHVSVTTAGGTATYGVNYGAH